MARKIPLRSWIVRQMPNMDPKFQKWEIFEGAGKSTKEEFITLING